MLANPSQVLAVDNLDDRREVYMLLARLSPAQRVAFSAWCCRHATLPGSAVYPKVARRTLALAETARWDSSADARLTLEIYYDVWQLCLHYDFSLDVALARLVGMVKGATGDRAKMLA